MGWRNQISREVSSSLPAVGIGLSTTRPNSKLKLPTAAPLPQLNQKTEQATLTPVGRAVQATSTVVGKIYAAPRLLRHASVVMIVAGVVLTGSTGHSAQLGSLAGQNSSTSSVLDDATAASVAAEVADQTQLIVTPEIDSNAKNLNANVNVPTSVDGTLASPDVVNTVGASAQGITTYTVQPGDTLQSLATEFNVSTDTISWANNLASGAALTPGQQLTILPVSGVQYAVQPGDTAQSIAAHFQADPTQITIFNNDQASGVQVGQTIVVPNGVMPQAAPVATSSRSSVASAGVVSSAPFLGSSVGTGSGYAFGYCTWYVATRRSIPGNWGNANQWYSSARAAGYSEGGTPQVGAIAWTGAGYFGHVAYVESVSGSNVTVSEMNWNGGWDRVDFRTVPASSFLYIY